MTNWIYVTFAFKNPAQYLIIQAIQAPLGIPFGEFFLKYVTTSKTDPAAYPVDDDFQTNANIMSCPFYTKVGPVIPNMLVYGTTSGGSSKIGFLFRWHDPPYADVAGFQFL